MPGSELKRVTIDFIITLIFEAKKHRHIIIAMLIGVVIGKLI